MTSLLKQYIIQEHEKNMLLERVRTFSQEDLRWKATKNDWSIREVLEHIVLGEQIVVQKYLERKQKVVHKKGLKNDILYYIVGAVLRLHIPVQIPAKSLDPINKHSLEQIADAWEISRNQFKKHITTLRSVDLEKAYFVHPVCGPITAQQALSLSKYHFAVHLKQIHTIIDSLTH